MSPNFDPPTGPRRYYDDNAADDADSSIIEAPSTRATDAAALRTHAIELQSRAVDETDPTTKWHLSMQVLELGDKARLLESGLDHEPENNSNAAVLSDDDLEPLPEYVDTTTEGTIRELDFRHKISELEQLSKPLMKTVFDLEETDGLHAADAYIESLETTVLTEIYGGDVDRRDCTLDRLSYDIFLTFGDNVGAALIEQINAQNILSHPIGHARLLVYAEKITGKKYR